MNKQQRKDVAKFLFDIPRREAAIKAIRMSMERLEERRNSPPDWTRQIEEDSVMVTGGPIDHTLERWACFIDEYERRMAYFEQAMRSHLLALSIYNDTLEAMSKDARYGYIATYIIQHKYFYRHTDEVIYQSKLYIPVQTYYRILTWATIFFWDVLKNSWFESVDE